MNEMTQQLAEPSAECWAGKWEAQPGARGGDLDGRSSWKVSEQGVTWSLPPFGRWTWGEAWCTGEGRVCSAGGHPRRKALPQTSCLPLPRNRQSHESRKWVSNHFCIRRENTTGAVFDTPKKWGCVTASVVILISVPVCSCLSTLELTNHDGSFLHHELCQNLKTSSIL